MIKTLRFLKYVQTLNKEIRNIKARKGAKPGKTKENTFLELSPQSLIHSDIPSGIVSSIFILSRSIGHSIWHTFWHFIWHFSLAFYLTPHKSDILSGIPSGFLFCAYLGILSGIYCSVFRPSRPYNHWRHPASFRSCLDGCLYYSSVAPPKWSHECISLQGQFKT